MEYIEAKRKIWDDSKQERIKLLGFDQDDIPNLVLDEQIVEEEVIETFEIFDELEEVTSNS